MPCRDCPVDDVCEDALEVQGYGVPGVCLACSHPVGRHTARIAEIILPQKGPCLSTGCIGFQAPVGVNPNVGTPCTRTVIQPPDGSNRVPGAPCGVPYKGHSNMNPRMAPLPQPSSSSSQRSSADDPERSVPWQNHSKPSATLVGMSTNGRRVDHYERVRDSGATTSAFSTKGVASARVPRCPFAINSKSVSVSKGKTVQGKTLHIYIFPESVRRVDPQSLNPANGYRPVSSASPKGYRIDDSRIVEFCSRLRDDANFFVTVVLSPGENIKQVVTDTIYDHLTTQVSVDVPSASDFFDVIWGNKPRSGASRRYEVAYGARAVSWWEKNVFTKAASIKEALAPANGVFAIGGHPCIALKLFHGYISISDRVTLPNDPEPLHDQETRWSIGCLPECNSIRDPSKLLHSPYPGHLPLHPEDLSIHSSEQDDEAHVEDILTPTHVQANRNTGSHPIDVDSHPVDVNDDETFDDDIRAAIDASRISAELEERRRQCGISSSSHPPLQVNCSTQPSLSRTRSHSLEVESRSTKPFVHPAVEAPLYTATPANKREYLNSLEQFRSPSAQPIIVCSTTVTNVPVIARLFVDQLVYKFGGGTERPVMPDGVHISISVKQRNLLPKFTVDLPIAGGQSVPSLFLNVLMDVVRNDASLWFSVSDDLEVINTCNLMSPHRNALCKAAAFVCAIFIAERRHLPPKFSPALIEALAHGEASVDDPEWLREFHSGASHALNCWPKDPAVPIPDNPETQFIASLFDRQVSHFTDMSIDARRDTRTQLVALKVLGISIGSFTADNHPILTAFKEVFNMELMHNHTILSLLGPNSKSILRSLTGSFPETGNDVLPCIDWVDSGISDEFTPYEQLFKLAFTRYINGVGHVQHSELDAIMPPEQRVDGKDDPALQARAFLRYLTGEDHLPRHGSRIRLLFSRPGDGEFNLGLNDIPVIMKVQTCFKKGYIRLGDDLKQLLDMQPSTQSDEATAFDVALHSFFAGPFAHSFQIG
ncbi:hypothetical protein PQX77_003593 [Marasmius sp. AFHP31]|nr:hypothetical protein PQX77_003593 [Marasmius sp. AFHP31]